MNKVEDKRLKFCENIINDDNGKYTEDEKEIAEKAIENNFDISQEDENCLNTILVNEKNPTTCMNCSNILKFDELDAGKCEECFHFEEKDD